MSRDEGLYLEDIQTACQLVADFTEGVNYKDFLLDDRTYHATVRNLEIIGEAVKHISKETRARYSAVKWRKVASFRDILAHEYFGVSNEIVWDVIENEIPMLSKEIEKIIKNEEALG